MCREHDIVAVGPIVWDISDTFDEFWNSVAAVPIEALVVDGDRAFVGSFNLDPRSANINSEIGLIVYSPVFARQVTVFLNEGIKPADAYHVVKDEKGRLRWETIVDGQPQTWSKDPETSGFKRFKAGFIEILPIEGQL